MGAGNSIASRICAAFFIPSFAAPALVPASSAELRAVFTVAPSFSTILFAVVRAFVCSVSCVVNPLTVAASAAAPASLALASLLGATISSAAKAEDVDLVVIPAKFWLAFVIEASRTIFSSWVFSAACVALTPWVTAASTARLFLVVAADCCFDVAKAACLACRSSTAFACISSGFPFAFAALRARARAVSFLAAKITERSWFIRRVAACSRCAIAEIARSFAISAITAFCVAFLPASTCILRSVSAFC